MNQTEKYPAFAALHVPGAVIMFNIWDAGSAQAVAEAARRRRDGERFGRGGERLGDAEGAAIGLALAMRRGSSLRWSCR